MGSRAAIHGLYAIIDAAVVDEAQLAHAAELVLDAGAGAIQYRDKSEGHHQQRTQMCVELARLCRRRGRPFIVNDDPELAAEASAEGVHLGRDDPDIKQARRRLGAGAIIGVSCYNNLDRALAAQAEGADYVAFGSFFPSRTKPRAVRAGKELLRAARRKLNVPIVAIGGITPENGATLIAQGADALAVIDGVFNQPDIVAAARRYVALFPADRKTGLSSMEDRKRRP